MSNSILILGESGTGKSSSLRNLPPEETMIINVIGKPLPFRGASSKYKTLAPDGKSGNIYQTDNAEKILKLIRIVDKIRQEIKYLVLDDFGYMMTNAFMRKALIKGYDKFSEIGKENFDILDAITNLRSDLLCFVMMHTELDMNGSYKPKTIGKMTDQYICIEGKFTHVLYTVVNDRQYRFLTNNDGFRTAKTPMGLFEEMYIDNDLMMIASAINDYEKGEEA